ncbi:rRNA maturation RNase YbeY [Dehalococcoidia bacterium]|nr:rRNA maturation RNase YbeY [Dehalococcoidia bacterium]
MSTVAMAHRKIQIQIFPAFRKGLSAPWLRRVTREALTQGVSAVRHNASRPCGVSLVIADDETIHRLNYYYRGLDEVTDVLAFAFDHPGQYEGEGYQTNPTMTEPFITPKEDADDIGEIIISYPQCLRQAQAQRHDSSHELSLLITHGVLHLLGYDHVIPQDELVMKCREMKTLAALGFPRAHS